MNTDNPIEIEVKIRVERLEPWREKLRGLHAEIVDLRNSGDTAGPRDQVVGYGAYVLH